jgi:hypothetical protein
MADRTNSNLRLAMLSAQEKQNTAKRTSTSTTWIKPLTLVEQPITDWEHLHERPQLLSLLQQLRKVLAAPPQSNPTQAHKRDRGTNQTSPKRPRTREDQSSVPPKKPTQSQRRDLPAYLRRPGGPDLRRHDPSGGEAGVRTVQAVHGGRVGWGRRWVPIGRARTGGGGGEGDGVCFYRRVSFSFSRCGGSTFFWKISAKPCAAHDIY